MQKDTKKILRKIEALAITILRKVLKTIITLFISDYLYI